MKKKLLTAACLLALSSTAFAAEVQDRSGLYFYGSFNDVTLDSSRDTDSSDAYGMGLGWSFNKNWSAEVNFFEGEFERNNPVNVGGITKGDIQSLNLDAMYSFTDFTSVNSHPYIKVGYGFYDAAPNPWLGSIGDVEAESYYKTGLGWQHFLTDRLFLRLGADFMGSGSNLQDDYLGYLAIGVFAGNIDTQKAAPAPKPVERAKDSDGDGVLDANDQCPGTPAGAAVDANGCPLDSDNDGVYDYQDACPGTAPGVRVDEKGCEVKVAEEVVVDMRLNFDTNKFEVKPEMVSEIAKVAEFLRQYPSVNAEIQGHTDSVGSSAYNQGLSERRANSVKDYLVSNFGIDSSRLSAKGYGEEEPIADNSTSEGRALNRRAEAHAETMTTK